MANVSIFCTEHNIVANKFVCNFQLDDAFESRFSGHLKTNSDPIRVQNRNMKNHQIPGDFDHEIFQESQFLQFVAMICSSIDQYNL